jgi:hypothetical protein
MGCSLLVKKVEWLTLVDKLLLLLVVVLDTSVTV